MGSFPEPDSRYDGLLLSSRVPCELWGEFKKWIRFYLHFCEKYRHNPADAKSLPLFIEKLVSKNQTFEQQACARQAVELYRGLLAGDWITAGHKETAPYSVRETQEEFNGIPSIHKPASSSESLSFRSQLKTAPTSVALQQPSSCQDHEEVYSDGSSTSGIRRKEHAKAVNSNFNSHPDFNDAPVTASNLNLNVRADGNKEEANAGWRDVETKLKAEIMLRHYSPKTFKTYALWTRKFRGFLYNKNPSGLTGGDAKAFLTDMAVKKGFSASAQNQAFK